MDASGPFHASENTARIIDHLVNEVFHANDGEYGAIGIHRELTERGIILNRKTVEKSLHRQGLRACSKRTYRKPSSTPVHNSQIMIPDLVHRHWDQGELNRVWVSDITSIKINTIWLHICVVMDGASRRVIGLAIDTHQKATLVHKAVIQAHTLRTSMIHTLPDDHRVIFHSDRGSQYTSGLMQSTCADLHLDQSMGRTGVWLKIMP